VEYLPVEISALLPVFDDLFQRGLGTVRTISFEELVDENHDVDLFALDARMRSQGMVLLGFQRAGTSLKLTLASDKRKILVPRLGDPAVVFHYAE